jgi:hypothetical protein
MVTPIKPVGVGRDRGLAWYPRSRITRCTASLVSLDTSEWSLTTRETVAIETPASSATCLIVTRVRRPSPGLLSSTPALKHVPERTADASAGQLSDDQGGAERDQCQSGDLFGSLAQPLADPGSRPGPTWAARKAWASGAGVSCRSATRADPG